MVAHSEGRAIERVKELIRKCPGRCPVNSGGQVTMTLPGFISSCRSHQKDSAIKIRMTELGRRPCKNCLTKKQIDKGKDINSFPPGISITGKFDDQIGKLVTLYQRSKHEKKC